MPTTKPWHEAVHGEIGDARRVRTRPGPSARARRALVIAVGIGMAATGCSSNDDPARPQWSLIRLVPNPAVPRDERFLVWGGTVVIGGVGRPVLSSSRPVVPEVKLGSQTPLRVVGGVVPPEFSAVPWFILEGVTTRNGNTTSIRSLPGPGWKAGTLNEIGLPDDSVGPDGTPGIVYWPVPDVAARDVETAEVTVPPGATLSVGIGFEPVSWSTTVSPHEMKVAALTPHGEMVLDSTRVDPRIADGRRWIDVNVALDDLAGQAVRFRFSGRPIAGSSAMPSLPVWAEPTIVDASAER